MRKIIKYLILKGAKSGKYRREYDMGKGENVCNVWREVCGVQCFIGLRKEGKKRDGSIKKLR